MKRALVYPGLLDFFTILLLLYIVPQGGLWTAFLYVLTVSALRIALYVFLSREIFNVSQKRALIKVFLFALPIPYVFISNANDWRIVVAMYISATTAFEFIFLLIKFHLTRRSK